MLSRRIVRRNRRSACEPRLPMASDHDENCKAWVEDDERGGVDRGARARESLLDRPLLRRVEGIRERPAGQNPTLVPLGKHEPGNAAGLSHGAVAEELELAPTIRDRCGRLPPMDPPRRVRSRKDVDRRDRGPPEETANSRRQGQPPSPSLVPAGGSVAYNCRRPSTSCVRSASLRRALPWKSLYWSGGIDPDCTACDHVVEIGLRLVPFGEIERVAAAVDVALREPRGRRDLGRPPALRQIRVTVVTAARGQRLRPRVRPDRRFRHRRILAVPERDQLDEPEQQERPERPPHNRRFQGRLRGDGGTDPARCRECSLALLPVDERLSSRREARCAKVKTWQSLGQDSRR